MDFALIWESLPKLLSATKTTLSLVALSWIFGLVFAFVVALCRVSKIRPLKWGAYGYIFFFRGTPLLIQLFLIYYGLSQFESVRNSILWPLLKQPYWCALLAFTLSAAAYIGELLRGGIQAVPHDQVEAGLAIGLTRLQIFKRIVLPQAVRITFPAYGNEIVYAIKDSSLASTVTILELTGMASTIVSRTYKPIEIFFVTGCIYLFLVFVVTRIFFFIERIMNLDQKNMDLTR